MINVTVRNNNVEKALRELKRKVKESDLLVELRERQEYTKPSAVKRKQRIRAKLRDKYQNIEEKRRYY